MKKKTQKPVSRKKIRNGERTRLEGVIQQQAKTLKTRNGQLRNGAKKQLRSEEQINICTKAMDSAADGIFIIDVQSHNFPIIYANKSFCKITGYEKNEILGQNYLFFFKADADNPIVNEISQALHKHKAFHKEFISFRKNGKKYWSFLRITPVRGSSGTVTHFVGIKTDVSLMRDREAKIDEQREELLHVTRVGKLAEFVSSLAHEISQPLTAILSYAQAVQRMLLDKEPEIQKILSYIINDGHRASGVIQRLRSLLKKGKPERKPLDFNTLINETTSLMATDATVRNCIIKTKIAADLPFIFGDRIQLQQVLLNLISNSFDAMENSQNPGEIFIRASRKNTDTIIVTVTDSGCGIPSKNIPKIFTHFFTSKPDGLGMGLPISRSIIKSHGGQLDVKNNPGHHGTTFYFTLPTHKRMLK